MDLKAQNMILGHISKIHSERHMHGNPPHIQEMLGRNNVVCYKCMGDILLNERYERIKQRRVDVDTKFYHVSCYESLWQ